MIRLFCFEMIMLLLKTKHQPNHSDVIQRHLSESKLFQPTKLRKELLHNSWRDTAGFNILTVKRFLTLDEMDGRC